jgi:hypothetical protein
MIFMFQLPFLASYYLSSSRERTTGVERENGEYTWRHVLHKWRKSMHNTRLKARKALFGGLQSSNFSWSSFN